MISAADGCELFRKETNIESDEDRALGSFHRLEIVGSSLRCDSHILKRESIRDDSAPAVGTKFDFGIHNCEKSVTTVLSPRTTPGLICADDPI